MTGVTNAAVGPRARAAVTVVALVLGLLPLLLILPAAAADPTETYPVPASGAFSLSGRGYGHGIGMSQFGAEGMGRLGKSYQEILDFYYPGTTAETVAADRAIRVSLSSLTRRESGATTVTVVPRSGLRAVAAGTPLDLPTVVGGEAVTAYRVLRTSEGLRVRAYAGAQATSVAAGISGGVRFSTAAGRGNSKVTLLSSGGSPRTFHGHILVRRSSSGLLVVDDVLLEHYLRAVVSLEIPGSWTPAALRAQAVAARSYALLTQRSARAAGQRYDICDTTSCQVFGSLAVESANEVKAVKATAGVYLASGGLPAFTQFSSANGGYSVAGSRGYLVAQPDPYDGVVTGSDNWGHSWQRTVTTQAIESAWPTIGTLKTLKVLGRDGNGIWGGRVQSVGLVGSKASVTVSADSFRWALGLKSTWWVVTNSGTVAAKAAPRQVRGIALDRALRVRWQPPKTDRPVTGYQVTVQPGDITKELGADRRRIRIRGLVNGVPYRARVAASYGSIRGNRESTGAVVPTSPESYFKPVSPEALYRGTSVRAVSDGGKVTVTVAGTGSVPDRGTRAVLLRVAAAGPSAASAVAWRTGDKRGRLTAASFSKGEPAVGTISVPVSADGRVSFGTTAAARYLRVDVVGYYTASGVNSWSFRAAAATRVADSLAGIGLPQGRVSSRSASWVKVVGRAGLPDSGIRAVLVNAALLSPSTDAQLSLARPDQSFGSGLVVRAKAGEDRAATAVVRVDDRGRIPIRLSAGRADVAVDVLGWFGPHDGRAVGRFKTSRGTLLDPRRDGPMGVGEQAQLRVSGMGSVPESAGSVVLLVRAYGAQTQGFVSLRPTGTDARRRPSVVFDSRGPTRNLVSVPIGSDGTVEVAVRGDAADVSVRIVGWYS